jgi:phage replication initiation protein
MNHSLCFYDRTPKSPNAKIDKDWANFIGNHGTLQISLPSNPMSLEKSIRWLIQNVSQTMKLIDSIGNIYDVDLLSMIVETGKLSEDKQKMLNTIKEQPDWFKEEIDVYTKELTDKQKSKVLLTP